MMIFQPGNKTPKNVVTKLFNIAIHYKMNSKLCKYFLLFPPPTRLGLFTSAN